MKKTVFVISIMCLSLSCFAQDYSKQFEVLKQSIEVKNGEALKPFISTEMAIPSFMTKEQLSPRLLEQIFADVFKRIQKVTLKKYKANEIVIFYDLKDENTKDRASFSNYPL